MRRFTLAAKVGAFTVVMVVAGYLIYSFVSKTEGARGGYGVFVRMNDASGIAKHSQVKIAGIGVGHIDVIRLDAGRARIEVKMNPDVPLYEDAAVTKASSSLLGEYYLSLAPGTEGKRRLKDGDEIKIVIDLSLIHI